jgi:S1-C subfamily serine protease
MGSRPTVGRRVTIFGAVAACVALAGGVSACTSTTTTNGTTNAAQGSSAAPSGAASELQTQYQGVIKQVLPSVVEIHTSNSTGSGVVYDDKGDIVTNAHVVGGAHTVQVLSSATSSPLEANVVGTFTPDDLAVIKVTSGASSLHPAHFGSSASITAGEIVMAMGSPLGLYGTVTQGIISATGRTVTQGGTSSGNPPITLVDALQTSASINSGNSGGALVDLAGQVIGIPTAAAQNPSSGAQAAGIGFAVPSDTVNSIAGQLISTGKVTSSGRAALDITGHDNVSTNGEAGGVTVASVTSGGAAEKAGIKQGDVIVSVNNEQTPNLTALTAILATLKPGQQVPVQYVRNGTLYTAMVTLGEISTP